MPKASNKTSKKTKKNAGNSGWIEKYRSQYGGDKRFMDLCDIISDIEDMVLDLQKTISETLKT